MKIFRWEKTLVSSDIRVTLKATPKRTEGNLGDLIGMLKHDGPAIPDETLCRSVDVSTEREDSERCSQCHW